MDINVTICDDEVAEIAYLSSLVRKWSETCSYKINIAHFDSGESFLFSYEDKKSVDILLLDIQMKNMDGISLSKKVRKEDENLQIIFITGYPDFIAEGYDVSALHYLLKPVKEEKLYEVLDRAVLRLQKTPRIIAFPKKGGTVKINANDIIYAEVFSHKVSLYLVNGKEEFIMRISDMEQLLGEGFFKCHRSYIVSMKHVKRVTKTAIILRNNCEIPLSRNLYDEANQAFIHYY